MSISRGVLLGGVQRLAAGCALSCLLTACSGGGSESGDDSGSTPDPTPAASTCDGTGAIEGGGRNKLSGVLTAVDPSGAVVVSGVRISTTKAQFEFDGVASDLSQLRPGEVVTVTGSVDLAQRTGCAEKVVSNADVIAEIDSTDVSAKTLVLLGQVVRVATETTFGDGLQLDSLRAGDRVRVSGLSAAGGLIARRIDTTDGISGEYFVTGAVRGVDTTAQTFVVGNYTVDYSGATLESFPQDKPSEGDTVRVSGRVSGGPGSTGTALKPLQVAYVDFRTPLSVHPATVSIQKANQSVQFEASGDGLPVNWSLARGGGGACSASVCGTIDASGRYVAPSDPVFDVLVTASSMTDSGITATAVLTTLAWNGVVVAGPHTVRGDVSLFGSGPLGDAAVNLWVNQPNGGYAYWYINGPLRTDANGQFTASNLPDSHVTLFASGLQPCAVTADIRGDTSVTVEVFPDEAFDSTSPPRPQLAATEPAVSGQVYEITADGRKPVVGARVYLEETMGIVYATTLSDQRGNYFVCNIDDLPTTAWLTVEADGFQNISVGPVNSPTDLTLDIRLARP